MNPVPAGRRLAGALLAALAALVSALVWPAAAARVDHRPNVIVVLTDDQRYGTLHAMPWLRGELDRAGSGWVSFPHAFSNVPLCCPARATLLTGRYPRHTGVLDNGDGKHFDESATLATWLHAAGYRTGLVGKYLNGYPFGRLPYVPPGWDRFVAKGTPSGLRTIYWDFRAVDQGSPVVVHRYATDWFAEHARRFVRTAPGDRPFFLLFAPTAPHRPWLPAVRHEGAYADLPIAEPPNVAGALRGAPPWVGSLPAPSAAQRGEWLDAQRRADETLLAVDDALRAIVESLGDRLDDTVILVLSDNGYSFGEHRWEGKRCPYEACVRIPLAVRSPWTMEPGAAPVSIVDLAPTILDLAHAGRPASMDGTSFARTIRAEGGSLGDAEESVLLGWAGDADVPPWTAVRTPAFKLIRYADGSEELYDLAGILGPADPWERVDRTGEPRYGGVLARLRRLLGRVPGPV